MPIFNELYNPSAPATIASGHETPATSKEQLPTSFTSPPLMPGFVTCLTDMLGPKPTPTPIQALSMKWLLEQSTSGSDWKQFLLASETGSGKSIAYLLPVLQRLKQSEPRRSNVNSARVQSTSGFELNPRALVLAPTHELARQLSGFAKKLLHEVKLRVLCVSRANVRNMREKDSSARKMLAQFNGELRKLGAAEATVHTEPVRGDIPVDMVVGTPMKLLEMARGRGWDREEIEEGSDVMEGNRQQFQKAKPEMGLADVEWVVVDEADVLFDPDFQEYTRMLLADISAARGKPVQYSPESSLSATALASGENSKLAGPTESEPLSYPFNLVLTTATIPSALASYLSRHHPNLIRLASPNLHHLPKTLKTEHVAWSGGNKFADIERRIRQVWADDSAIGCAALSKVLVFCNKSTKVTELGEYLTQQGIKNIALTSTSEERRHGSNKHLEGFLRLLSPKERREQEQKSKDDEPRVMITTSLLSRGLDFSPDIRHVFIVDEPRNMIDFLHRAGRSGRAGQKGKVVIFGKMKGRGSSQAKEAKKRVGALVA
ncbi:hypothetical protein AX15_006234 [Amanita polypyramis BW_CC]|nr:hypothetical protein AX15_006234 [Amanita polypyramis BW_CC]